MVVLGIGVKVATLPVIALGVGIGVDYALYLLSVQLAQQRAGVPLDRRRTSNAVQFTGKVVALVGITLAAGVITWAFSPIKFQADMGILLTFMFLWNMIGALVLIPALSYFLLPTARRAQRAPRTRCEATRLAVQLPTSRHPSRAILSGELNEQARHPPHAVGARRAAVDRPASSPAASRRRPRRRSSTAIALRYTYATLAERVRRLASALAALGVEPGSTVAMMDWDSHRYLECFFAVPMMGAVLHTVNVRISPEQMLYTINHAQDDVILVNAEFLPMLEAIHDEDPARRASSC